MEGYLFPIKTAILAFPMIAALITMPYVVYQYKKYGAIPILRTVILYSFSLYLLCIYFLVILPLPTYEDLLSDTSSGVQLVPFMFVSDFFRETSLNLSDPGTYLPALLEPCVYVVGFNLIMFLPLGIYLRYYFRCGWKKTLLTGFLLSLFFELTQLTGLYGIYPRGWRLCDVDDLMLNSLGCMLGYFIAPLAQKLLPSRESLDQRAYEKGEAVPFLRRFLAMMADWILIGLFTALLGFVLAILLPWWELVPLGMIYFLQVFVYFVVQPWVFGGYTLGKRFFRLKIVTEEDAHPRFYQYALRYGILYGFLVPLPYYFTECLYLAGRVSPGLHVILNILAAFFLGIYLYFFMSTVARVFGYKKEYRYGRLSRTRNRSTIQRPEADTVPGELDAAGSADEDTIK